MNRGTIVTAAQAIYNEETSDSIPSTYLQARYNEAKSRLERRTRCHPVKSTFDLTLSTRIYILPAGMFAIRKGGVIIAGYGPIQPIVWADLVKAYTLTWDVTQSTYPTCFYLAEETVMAAEVTNWGLGFYPIPSATVTNGVSVHGYGVSADASADATAPPWPTPWHMALVWELCVMAAVRDIGMEMRNAKALIHFRGELAQYEAEMRSASDERSLTGGTVQIGGGAQGPTGDDDAISTIVVTT